MKLAEALLLRADMQKKFASLQARAQSFAVVQEGERQAEDPTELLRQVEAVISEMHRLVFAINKANLEHKVRYGQTLTEALAQRDALTQRHSIVQGVINACTRPPDRYGV